MSGATELPDWWPKGPEFALLDSREQTCRLFHWSAKSGSQEWSEPAYLRLGEQGTPIVWGRRAKAWLERETPVRLRQVFPQGWPQDSVLARWYLERFALTYLSSRKRWKVLVTEERERRWIRRLWRESLEDSALQVEGFLLPWQHDLVLASLERPDLAMGNHLHLALEEGVLSWRFIRRGELIASGKDANLSRQRLIGLIAEHARRHLHLETSDSAVIDLLATTELADSRSRQKDLPFSLAGRHLPSGLPTRTDFVWARFFESDSTLVDAWQMVKQRITEQAKRCCEVTLEPGPGLDLPGWRVLCSGALSSLLLEGPLAHMLEDAR